MMEAHISDQDGFDLDLSSEHIEPMLQVEIVEAPSEEALYYLLSEDMYQGTLSWQGNKTSTKFNYDKPKKNSKESPPSYD